MKKVLLINPFFHEKERIGSVRLNGIAKFLPKFGWDPYILTSGNSSKSEISIKSFEVQYENQTQKWKKRLKRTNLKPSKTKLSSDMLLDKNNNKIIKYGLELWEEFFTYPDAHKSWFKPAIKVGSEIIKNENIDAIISSSHPVTSHLIALNLQKKYKIPWIADLRDLWSQNPYHNFKFRSIIDKRLEIKTLKEANALTTTTDVFANSLRELHKQKKVYSIQNGFDPEITNPGIPLTKKLSLIYTGNLYNGKRDPELLFKALNNFDSMKLKEFQIDFYGPKEPWLINKIKKYNLEEIIVVNGPISKNNVIMKQWKSQLLLLLTWNDPKEIGIIPGKIFEYLAAKRPIISIGPPKGPVQEIIKNTNTGIHLSDLKSIENAINDYYKEYQLNGKIKFSGVNSEINKFNQINMAKKFALVLNNCFKL